MPAAPPARSIAVFTAEDRPMTVRFVLNGREAAFDGDPDMPLLWYLRDHARLTGTKYGCGLGLCGACTVHVDDTAARSCSVTLGSLAGKSVRTIEALAGDTLHAVQQAWIEEDVAQCGYCQAGQIMAAVDLLRRTPLPSDDDIAALTNLCRCGTYPRIRKAVRRAAQSLQTATSSPLSLLATGSPQPFGVSLSNPTRGASHTSAPPQPFGVSLSNPTRGASHTSAPPQPFGVSLSNPTRGAK